MKHRLKSFMAIALSIVLLTGCGQASTVEEAPSLTLKEGVLQVGTHIGYIPMEYYDEDNHLTGFDMELAQLLAEEMNMELETSSCAWDAIFINMENQSFDVIISSVSYTKDREAKYALSTPYLTNGLVLVVPSKSTVTDIVEMQNQCIGVQLATTSDTLISSYIKAGNSIEVAQYENVENAFDALKRGEIQGVCADSVVASFFLTQNKGYRIAWLSDQSEPLCICMPKGNTELQEKINTALKDLESNGKLQSLSRKYFGADYITNMSE